MKPYQTVFEINGIKLRTAYVPLTSVDEIIDLKGCIVPCPMCGLIMLIGPKDKLFCPDCGIKEP